MCAVCTWVWEGWQDNFLLIQSLSHPPLCKHQVIILILLLDRMPRDNETKVNPVYVQTYLKNQSVKLPKVGQISTQFLNMLKRIKKICREKN